MEQLDYGIQVELPSTDYSDAIDKVTAALQDEGFGILTDIDIQATLKKKLDADFKRYIILGACNPSLAKRALETENQIGLFLPCNVVVQERDGGGSIVSAIDPNAMFSMIDNPLLEPIVKEVNTKLRSAIGSLEG